LFFGFGGLFGFRGPTRGGNVKSTIVGSKSGKKIQKKAGPGHKKMGSFYGKEKAGVCKGYDHKLV